MSTDATQATARPSGRLRQLLVLVTVVGATLATAAACPDRQPQAKTFPTDFGDQFVTASPSISPSLTAPTPAGPTAEFRTYIRQTATDGDPGWLAKVTSVEWKDGPLVAETTIDDLATARMICQGMAKWAAQTGHPWTGVIVHGANGAAVLVATRANLAERC